MACASDEPLQFVMPTPCAWCETEEDVNSFCKECHQYLCDPCKRLHSKGTHSKSHTVVPFTEGYKIKQENIILCGEHDEPFSVYCRTCRRHICVKCLTSEVHKGHNFIGIQEFGDELSNNVKREIEAKSSECDRLLSEITKLNERNQEYVEKCEDGISEMEMSVQNLVKAAKKIQSEMKENINIRKSALSKKYSEKLDELRSQLNDNRCRITEIDREFQCQSRISIVKFADQASQSLRKVQMPILPIPPDLTKAVFTPGVVDDAVLRQMVGDIESEETEKTSVPHGKGESKEVLSRFSHVQQKATASHNELLQELATVREFVASSSVKSMRQFYDTVWSFCVVNDNEECVGVKNYRTDTNKLLLIRSDGTVIKTITNKSINVPFCLTPTDNYEILVSSYNQQILRVCLDDSSVSVFASVCKGQSMTNIVTTKDKEFLVALGDDCKRPILHHLDKTGKLKEEIDIGQGLYGDDVGVVERMCNYLGDEYLVKIKHKLYVLDPAFVLRVKAVLKEEWKVNKVTSDKHGHIICCNRTGDVFVLDQSGHLIGTYKLKMDRDDNLYCLQVDTKNILWLGTRKGWVKIIRYLQ